MRRALLLAGALALGAACASPAPAPPQSAVLGGVALQNADFEAAFPAEMRCATAWHCTAHANGSSYRYFGEERDPGEGRRSACIERVLDEPWSVMSQALFDASLRGRRLRLSMAFRVEGVAVGAGPIVRVQGGSGEMMLHEERLLRGTLGWRRMTIEFEVPALAAAVEVGATLQGVGTACFDDVRLEILAPIKNPV